MKLNEKFLERMQQATQLLQSGGPQAATAAIQRALKGDETPIDQAGLGTREFVDINPAPDRQEKPRASGFMKHILPKRWRDVPDTAWANPLGERAFKEGDSNTDAHTELPGQFLSASCTNRAGTRSYKVYIPSGYKGEALPLIVMLHGCKQNPNDFAAGTKMNQVAEKNNCLVVYPAQVKAANSSNCWQWFQPSDQKREGTEPSIIADITRKVMREYRVDPDRVYIAGLSAGAAMAAILAAAYPELYAAVGIHSGLPIGSAHDVPSAFAAMKGSGKASRKGGVSGIVPAIVFHGDNDHTVNPDNGTLVLAQCLGTCSEELRNGRTPHGVKVIQGKVENGRAYTRTIYSMPDETPIAEYWKIHAAGHAWSGGSPKGSYTDAKGPDAAEEMMRFFITHRHERKPG